MCSPPTLVAVFVGTSVSTTSAEKKHYYAQPSKPLLGASGCDRATNRARWCSSRDRELTDYGVGLTDLVTVGGAASDGLLESSHYERSGCIASDRARAPADAVVRVARLRPMRAIPALNLGVRA